MGCDCNARCWFMHLSGCFFALLGFLGCGLAVLIYVVAADKTEVMLKAVACAGAFFSLVVMLVNACACCKCGKCGKGEGKTKWQKIGFSLFVLVAAAVAAIQYIQDPTETSEAACDYKVACGGVGQGGTMCNDLNQRYTECTDPDVKNVNANGTTLFYYNKWDDCDTSNDCRAFETIKACVLHKFQDGNSETDPKHVCDGYSPEEVFELAWISVVGPMALCFLSGCLFLAATICCGEEASDDGRDVDVNQQPESAI